MRLLHRWYIYLSISTPPLYAIGKHWTHYRNFYFKSQYLAIRFFINDYAYKTKKQEGLLSIYLHFDK